LLLQSENEFVLKSMPVRRLHGTAICYGHCGVRFLHIEHHPGPAYTVFEPKGGGGGTGMVGTNPRSAMKG